MARRTVAVVGGGCAGVLATREVLRGSDDKVVLIEPDEPGGGLAYGSARPWHLLNSRAGAMSADPDDPGQFARWADCSPADFRPRPEYGAYLRTVFASTAAEYAGRLDVRRSAATGLTSHGVTLAGGGHVRADEVVVATGNPAPAQPAARPDHPDYLADPWAPGALDAIPADVPVLLIGAGLTAIDVALTLTADRNRDAPITAAGGLLVELEAGVQWFGAVVNCAGPGRLPAAAGSFVGSLLAAGQARVGPHGLGLDIDAAGRLVGADGRARPGLWLIGPLRRGARWETTAVPEIRQQARQLTDARLIDQDKWIHPESVIR